MNASSSFTPTMAARLQQAKEAFQAMACLTTAQKNEALETLARLIDDNPTMLLEANQKDLAANEGQLAPALFQRLKLDEGKLTQLVQGLRDVTRLADPTGQVTLRTELDSGLILERRTVPLGLIGIIFESRPDVMPQIMALILKSGNAVVFKGGREAQHSNAAFMALADQLAHQCPFLPPAWVTLLESREDVQAMLAYPQFVDLVIPRGSNALVQHIMANTRIPVLGHADGVCHLYVHPSANLDEALPVIIDSKTQYPSACNALETLLVDAAVAEAFLPRLWEAAQQASITLKVDDRCLPWLPGAELATEEDWRTEYGNLTLAIKLVDSLPEAVAHINRYGSHHTDGILAQDAEAIARFVQQVDSASVFANASTRFADGFRYGFGAEIGISTARTHARGPVGLEGLVSTKYVLTGQHHQVAQYVGATPQRHFTHRPLG